MLGEYSWLTKKYGSLMAHRSVVGSWLGSVQWSSMGVTVPRTVREMLHQRLVFQKKKLFQENWSGTFNMGSSKKYG